MCSREKSNVALRGQTIIPTCGSVSLFGVGVFLILFPRWLPTGATVVEEAVVVTAVVKQKEKAQNNHSLRREKKLIPMTVCQKYVKITSYEQTTFRQTNKSPKKSLEAGVEGFKIKQEEAILTPYITDHHTHRQAQAQLKPTTVLPI